MSAGHDPGMFDHGAAGRDERAHIYQALGAVEKAQVALFTQADERERSARERAATQDARMDRLEEGQAECIKATRDSRITPMQILLATSPITTGILGLIGVIIAKGGP